MNNIMKTLMTTLLSMTMILNACTKESTDTESPTINIVAPVNNEQHTSGDEMHIHVEFSDNDELHEISAVLTQEHMGNTDTVWSKFDHVDASTFTIMDHYTIGTVMHTNFSLIVIAEDHSGNLTTSSTAFHVMQ